MTLCVWGVDSDAVCVGLIAVGPGQLRAVLQLGVDTSDMGVDMGVDTSDVGVDSDAVCVGLTLVTGVDSDAVCVGLVAVGPGQLRAVLQLGADTSDMGVDIGGDTSDGC